MKTKSSTAAGMLAASIGLFISYQSAPGLTNSDVITMHEAGISADTLVVAVDSASEKNFDVSTSSLIKLKEAGLDEAVIQAILMNAAAESEQSDSTQNPAVEEKNTMASLFDAVQNEPPPEKKQEEVPPAIEDALAQENVTPPSPIIEKTAPQPISQPAPVFPQELREEGVSGSVKVKFAINPDGDVQDIRVVESDHELFSKAAMDALNAWKFKPGLENGEPVNCVVALTIPFNIKEKRSELNRAPVAISRPSPIYPRELRKNDITGEVKVQFVVTETGDVQDIKVLESDHERFTEEALKVLEKWEFSPALKDGQPIASRVKFTVPFKIRN